MERLEKRFIYSAFLSGLFFIIVYVLVDFPIIVSILLSALVYVAGIFIFKSYDIRVYDQKALAKYNFEMSKLNDYKEKIKDNNIRDKLTKIVSHTQKICEHLQTQPKNATKIYNFLDYYLPFTDNIVTKYLQAEKKEEKTFVENKLILKMTVYIREVEQETNKLLAEIIKSKDKAFDFEMKIFEMKSDFESDEDEGSDKDA